MQSKETQTAETQTAETQTAETQTTETQTAETQTAETQTAETQTTETQTTENENNVPSVKKTPEPDYMSPKKPRKSEPITQVQRDSVITDKDIPDLKFRVGVTLVVLIIFLFVAAIYYGIINP